MKKVTKLFVAKDAAVATTGITLSASSPGDGKVVIFNADDNAQYEAANDDPATSPEVFIVQGDTTSVDAQGNLLGHRTSETFRWKDVVGFKAEKFKPARNNVWYVGAAPAASSTYAAGTGSIVVTNSSEYEIVIKAINNKDVEPTMLRYNYTSDSTATQAEIAAAFATKIANDIANGNSAASKILSAARKVGDGTGVDGLTSPTDYGIQIIGAPGVKIAVGCKMAMVGTTITEDVGFYAGIGTYSQMQDMEADSLGNKAHKNRIWFPYSPTLYVSTQSNSPLTSTNASGTIDFTQGSKAVATTTGNITETLATGDAISVEGVVYTIKSVGLASGNTNTIVLNEPFRGSNTTFTASSSAFATTDVAKIEGYNLVVLDVISTFDSTRAGVTKEMAAKCFIFAVPSYVANASAYTTFLGELSDGLSGVFPAISSF